MRIKIINARTGRIFFETGSLCQPIKFLAIDRESFSTDYVLDIIDIGIGRNYQMASLSLNSLAEILDALKSVIIKLPIEVKHEH